VFLQVIVWYIFLNKILLLKIRNPLEIPDILSLYPKTPIANKKAFIDKRKRLPANPESEISSITQFTPQIDPPRLEIMFLI
jgi:hypothetical protein